MCQMEVRVKLRGHSNKERGDKMSIYSHSYVPYLMRARVRPDSPGALLIVRARYHLY